LVNIQINSVRAGQNSLFILSAVRNHVRGWPGFFNGFFIFSATTSGVNALYNSSRILHALASIPEAWPLWAQNSRRRLERTTSRGVPLATITVSWLFGLLAFLSIKPFPSVVLGRVTNNAVVSELIGYAVICLAYIQFYHRIKEAAQDHTLENRSAFNRDDKQYPYRTHGQLFRAYYGFIFCLLLIVFNNWQCFVRPFSTPDFISSYIGVSSLQLTSNKVTLANRTKACRILRSNRCISCQDRWLEPFEMATKSVDANSTSTP
jgi:amino acid transporter